MSSCEDVRADLGGYVVGGLDEADIARVEAHLDGCAACRAELEELSALPGLLELAADESPQVPPDLRERALAHATAGSADGASRPGSDRRTRRTFLAAAAAALAGAVVGVGAVLAAVSAPPADTVVELASARDAALERVDGEAALRDTDAGVRVDVRAAGLPAGVDYYHVWLEWPSGEWISAGTFRPTRDGRVEATMTCGGELADYAAFTITAHPGDGDGETVVRAPLD